MTINSVYSAFIWKAHFLPGSRKRVNEKSSPNLMAVKDGACQEHWLTQLRVQLFGDAYVYGLSYRLVQEMEREFRIFP